MADRRPKRGGVPRWNWPTSTTCSCARAFGPEAREYGLPSPKGIALIGIPEAESWALQFPCCAPPLDTISHMRFRPSKRDAQRTRALFRHLGLKGDAIPEQIRLRHFQEAGLLSSIRRFSGSLYAIVNNAYPGCFRPFRFKATSQGMWQGRKGLALAKEATRWMIEERLKWSNRQIAENLCARTFSESGIFGALGKFGGSPARAIRAAYPGRFMDWEFRQTNMWRGKAGRRLAAKATRWMIEKKLHWNSRQIYDNLRQSTFRDHGLSIRSF